MSRLTAARFKKRPSHRWVIAMGVIGFVLLLGTIGYSTAKVTSIPTAANASTAAQSFTPFLDIVPAQDGTELYISAGGVGELGGTVFVNIGVGPGHDKDSWTMTYSDTVRAYVATATGFTPNTGASGPLSITTTLGLDSGAVEFNRAYVPAATIQSIPSMDGNLELTLVTTDTIAHDTYVAVVPSYGPPGPVPMGYRLVGSAYSARAAGALLVTDRPMGLRLYYSDVTLAGAAPHTLSIQAWDAYYKRWNDLGGRLFYDQHYLSVATSRFTTYAMMTTPAWRDEFDDFSGLSFPGETHHVTLGGTLEDRTLVLQSTATNGVAVSKPITPTAGFAAWGSLTFTRTADPPTTTLTVDVLSLDGTPLLTDVVSGVNLAGLGPAQYPALKLRANLSSTVVGETPALDAWRLGWEVEEYRIYLPVVIKW